MMNLKHDYLLVSMSYCMYASETLTGHFYMPYRLGICCITICMLIFPFDTKNQVKTKVLPL